MNMKCPVSTPRLKNSSAVGICPAGSPASLNPPAKPRPWTNPNVNATSHGAEVVVLVIIPKGTPDPYSPKKEETHN